MAEHITFKYFPDYLKWARLSDQPCDECPDSPCLKGIYFDSEDDVETVCLDSLVSGKVTVHVPQYLQHELIRSIRTTFPDWAEQQVNKRAAQAIDTLSKTPPVPWIQHNAWPVCHGDFCRYLGEWDQTRLNNEAPDGQGLSYLMSILTDADEIEDPDALWESIRNEWTTIFVFECLSDGQRIAIEQSY